MVIQGLTLRPAMNTTQFRPENKQTSRRRGFAPASLLLSRQIQKVAETRGFAVARLLTHWPEIAGEELAAVTRPVRISHSRSFVGATLTLLTKGSAAPLVEMQRPVLLARINACYGYNAVQKIVITQTSASGFQESQSKFTAAPKKQTQVDPAIAELARRIADGFEDEKLAKAMHDLALNVSTRNLRKDT